VTESYDTQASPTLVCHYAAVLLPHQALLRDGTSAIAMRLAHTATMSMGHSVEIIDATIDALIAQNVALSARSTLEWFTEQIHAKTQSRLFKRGTTFDR
jgi:hypothetical protein